MVLMNANSTPNSPPPVDRETGFSDLNLWFSWQGRINRGPYFVASVLVGGLAFVAGRIPDNYPLLFWPSLLVILISSYVSIVLSIKRSHDRGKSGFFVVLCFIPFINLWPAIELLFLRGDEGRNDYGENPLKPIPSPEVADT
jgi:uncharacterized membrane protein YhaH (DUF805 family)